MNPRLIASLAIGAAVVLGTTGCSMISPQATTIPYSAAEGVNVWGSGPLEVRNALIVANEDGSEGNFVAAIVNQTDESQTLHIEFGEGGDVDRGDRPRAGEHRREPRHRRHRAAAHRRPRHPARRPTSPAYFQSGDAEGTLVTVPVLDGGLRVPRAARSLISPRSGSRGPAPSRASTARSGSPRSVTGSA